MYKANWDKAMLNDVFFWWSRKTHRFLLTKYLLGFEVSPANNSFCETAKQNKNCFYEKCWWNYFQHLCSPRVHQPGFNNLLTTRLLKRGNPPFCCRHRSWGWWIFFSSAIWNWTRDFRHGSQGNVSAICGDPALDVSLCIYKTSLRYNPTFLYWY